MMISKGVLVAMRSLVTARSIVATKNAIETIYLLYMI